MLLVNSCSSVIDFNTICSLVSILLGVLSIIISLILYKVSTQTSKQLAENAAKLAIDYSNTSKTDNTKIELSQKQFKILKKQISKLYKAAKKNSKSQPWVNAAAVPVYLKCVLNEDKTVALMKQWKENNYISWQNDLDITTKIFINNKEDLIESINPCKS